MRPTISKRFRSAGVAPAIVLLFTAPLGHAQQSVKAQGLIEGRSGPTIILKAADSSRTIVLLTDTTKVSQTQGVLKARKKEMSMAALIPGLAISVEGDYNDRQQLVAKSVKFNGDDLKRANAIQAGLRETQKEGQQNKEELERHNAELQAQNQALQKQQQELATQQEKVAANKTAIDAAVARFGQLDDYYILDEVVVYFANGKAVLEPKYKPQLSEFAGRARNVEAYMVQVVGYASSTGSEELNQKLSEDRARNVTNFLLQQCRVPLTNVMAPAAMGESQQISAADSAEGQAENRRVVVRVLQNKGVAGMKGPGTPQE